MTNKIRLTKEFDFEAAHALDGFEGKCKDIHGHSYHLKVTVLGYPNKDSDHPNCGMVMDFAEIKSIVNNKVLKLFDHRLLLRNDSRFKGIEKNNERVRYVDYQPTCENMLIDIVSILKVEFADNIVLISVLLRETKSSFAEWRLEDNISN
jgi:6-pyruvoyltetrahydropterin/6-carboxytetrahydropterin synthase